MPRQQPSKTETAPKSALSRHVIVAQAMELVDSRGLNALSMRNIASLLNVSPGALYPYIDSKENLVHLLIDELWKDLDLSVFENQNWQLATREMAIQMRQIFSQHQDLVKLTLGRIPMGANFALVLEGLISRFHKDGLPAFFAFHAGDLIGLYTAAFVYEEYVQKGTDSPSGEEKVSEFRKFLTELPEQDFPHIHSAVTQPWGEHLDRYTLGLDVIIAGLDATFTKHMAMHARDYLPKIY